MTYFKIVYDYNGCEDCIFLRFNKDELPFARYDVYESKRLDVQKIYCTVTQGAIGDCDYLANNLAYLIVSEKVKSIFEKHNLCDCQFIEVYEKESNILLGYLVNCLNHYEALDEPNSICKRFSEDDLMVVRFAILEDKTDGKDFFQLQENIFPYFISKKLKQDLQKSHVTGFDFERVLSPKK